MLTVLAVMLTLVVLNLTVTFILGPTVHSKNFPLMIAIRYINLADFVENLESFAIACLDHGIVSKNFCLFLYSRFKHCTMAKSFRLSSSYMAIDDYRCRIFLLVPS